MQLIKVFGKEGYYRDKDSGAIIKTNQAEKNAFLQKREREKRQKSEISSNKEKINQLSSRIDQLEGKLNDIIDILRHKL